ncbi:MAG: hypothetical protein C5B59_17225 [Bacteroidetes bacterium]|nr:MAG: hypothetical protein C5B59_17225 [Bacteroidota bacterium]
MSKGSKTLERGHKSKAIVHKMFSEVYDQVPRNVVKTGKKGKAKRKMMTAIALSKARRAGARV